MASVDDIELVKTVPYERNTLVLFLNSLSSVHGVTIRQPSDRPRCFVNLVTQTSGVLFDLGSAQVNPEEWHRRRLASSGARPDDPKSRGMLANLKRSVRSVVPR